MSNSSTLLVDHPGSFIAEELEARGWAQADLAYIWGIDVSQLNRLIKGNTDITPDSAVALGDAFDMPAEFFMNLQKIYDLQKAQKADPGVKTRAAWVTYFPVREMIKRGWIEDTEPSLLDLQMLRFFNKKRVEDIPFIGDAPVFAHAAKKTIHFSSENTTPYDNTTPTQYAWLHRVRKIAESIDAPLYCKELLKESLHTIRAHMLDKDDLRHIPEILRKSGVRFVLVEALPTTKIDGVCLWLEHQPVIGMSLRWDRMDNFCFVLRHEIEHVLRGDGKEASFSPVDEFNPENDQVSDIPECEIIANKAAADFCVAQDLLDSFIVRKSPFISEQDVLAFSARVKINPSVIVGQIQNKTKKYGWLRKYQTSIKDYLIDWKYKDGWGYFSPTNL